MARSDLWGPLDSLFLLLILQKEIATWAFNQWLILLPFSFLPKFHRFSLCTSNNQLLLLALEKKKKVKKISACTFHSVFHSHPSSYCMFYPEQNTYWIFEIAFYLTVGFLYRIKIGISYLQNTAHTLSGL